MEAYCQIEGNKYAKIYTEYRLGGYNNFRGTTDERGIVIYLNTVERDGSMERMTPMDRGNFKMMLKPLSRRSQKQEQKIDEAVQKRLEELFPLYIEKGHSSEVLKLLREIEEEVA